MEGYNESSFHIYNIIVLHYIFSSFITFHSLAVHLHIGFLHGYQVCDDSISSCSQN